MEFDFDKDTDDRTQYTLDVSTKKGKKKSQKVLSIKDLLIPQITSTGSFLGFKVRDDLTRVVMMQNQYDPEHLKKLLKICIYMNKLIRDGYSDEYNLDKNKKNFKSVGCQASGSGEDETLHVQNKEYELQKDLPKDFDELNAEKQVLAILKNHAVDVVTRMNPENKGQCRVKWEKQKMDDLLDLKLEKVFHDERHEGGVSQAKTTSTKKAPSITFRAYLQQLLD